MSTYLVTGGAGFIGSHLCDALVQRGDSVRVLDNLSSGSRDNLPPSTTLIEADVTDSDAVSAALSDANGCFHLAAIASVERAITDWLGSHRTNLTGTLTVFDAIRRMDKKIPVVYASSAAVYGDNGAVAVTEDTDPRPVSAYGVDKYACELHARVAAGMYGVPGTGLRFFNVYGPRQDPRSPYSGVISIFCERLLQGEPVDIFGDGTQTRDFVYISDVISALLSAMQRRLGGAPVFNVSTGHSTSVLDLARIIAELAGARLQVRHLPRRIGEIRDSAGDPRHMRATLGLGAPVPLRTGLGRLLDWLRAAR